VILTKAEGNPFFLEELTLAVLEYGDQQEAMAVPDTIQGVLMARLDRLPEAPKHLLQTASILGREFSLRLLTAIWDDPEAPPSLLQELTRLEFLYKRTGVEEPTYVFKHALTQEVAYESLLTTHRQALHTAAGQALEALYSGRLEEAQDRLAYHYAQTDAAPKAVEYLNKDLDYYDGLPWRVIIDPERLEDGQIIFVASHPEFDGVLGTGETPEAALADLQAARRSMIEALLAEGYPVPEPAVVSSVAE
jgi:predicted RNase H-like HicB family nuclease